MAPLLAGQVDTDISSLLETAETRCSNKTDLSSKSEMPQRKEKACCKQRSSPTAYVWVQSLITLDRGDSKTLCFFTGQLKDEL